MKASEIISSSILTLHPDDDGVKALEIMSELRLSHLPIVRDDFYLGVISKKEILDWNSNTEFIDEHLAHIASPYVSQHQHIFDIIEIAEKNNLSVVPVINENKQYKGSISHRKLLYTIAKISAIQSIGGVIVLNINQQDYMLSEVSRIIENHDAKILSSYITSSPNSQEIELTLKINKLEITSIIDSFERYGYSIVASYEENQEEDNDLLKRYESLMKFLNP